MKKIKILTAHEIQYISAGEVIENWASIVKELVENSIDAKSEQIVIRYSQNGFIEIEDNGEGIDPLDLPLVFVSHATSKFDSLDNLSLQNNIFFGFRGEALAAIAGVSKTEIISRERGTLVAHTITSFHGKISNIEKTAGNYGTLVRVSELFDNVGARKKYFQSRKQEEKNILYVVRGLAISHPKVTFSLYYDDKLIVHYLSRGNFIDKAKLLLYQPEACYTSIDYSDEYFSLSGIISNASYGHYDKSRIYILANNRLVKQNNLLQPCIKPYYAENFVKRYPELYLQITVPADQIDINVHPRKEEVLFLYQKKIERILFQVIESHLQKNSSKSLFINKSESIILPDFTFNQERLFDEKKICESEKKKNDIDKKNSAEDEKNSDQVLSKKLEKNLIESFENNETHFVSKENTVSFYDKLIPDFKKKINETVSISSVETNNFQEIFPQEAVSIKDNQLEKQLILNEDYTDKELQCGVFGGQYLGTLKNTYLILLKENSVVYVDQHALHEKILYEKYLESFSQESLARQPILFSEKENLTEEEYDFFNKEKRFFNSIGIEYLFDGSFLYITDAPLLFMKIGVLEVLKKTMGKLFNSDNLTEIEKKNLVLHEIAALYGCKNAVKAGDNLAKEEVLKLLMIAKNLKNASFCPHGRPIYYEFSASQLDVLCKRT